MKQCSLLIGLASCAAVWTAGAFEVQNVTARQRWPWNSLIDIDYEIASAAAGDAFAIDVTATYDGGTKTIVGRTYKSDPVGAPGSNRLVWDFGADAAGVKAADLRVSVTASPLDDKSEVYCVIDVAGGKDATKYPVRYTRQAPVHTPNCTTDVCKLTEIWLRRIHPASRDFTIASWRTPADDNNSYYVRLSKDYYIGVFEVTQQQWFQLTGDWPSALSNKAWRATRPFDKYYPALLFGNNGWKWPDDKSLKANCLLDKMRRKTGLGTLNLPTEAQWMFAETAGPTKGSEMYRYKDPNGRVYDAAEIMRYKDNAGTVTDGMEDATVGSACVGSYAPNNFGLYDMLGNVGEDCLDPRAPLDKMKKYYQDNGVAFPIMDPEGLPQATAKELNGDTMRVASGYSYLSPTTYMTLWHRGSAYTDYCSDSKFGGRGIRLCITCE